jgi:RNA polymerase sigma-70 factor (ECF subfamily)
LEEQEFQAVVYAAQHGDQAALTLLFRELQPRLLRFLRAQAPQAADDLAGEVWLNFAHVFPKFTGDEIGLRALVFTIARRRLTDHIRAVGRRRTDAAGDSTSFAAYATTETSDDQALSNLGAQQATDLIVAALNPEQAEVVLLRVLGDLDVDQVAEITGRSANWVRVTQHRALRRLAERIGPRLGVMR